MVESPDAVTFSNGGYFLPGTVLNAIEQTGPQKYYRNFALCQGMVSFNMTDPNGCGIRRGIHRAAKTRLSHAGLSDKSGKKAVTVTVYGKQIKEQYYRLLKASPDLSLTDCIAPDRVQKHELIGKESAARLRRLHLTQGRYPKISLSDYACVCTRTTEPWAKSS